jgi:FkbM family methyltransferase
MEQHLQKGDVLFDVGTEQGWCNLAYAQIVGAENMVLIEPTVEFWPNIKALWEKNFSVKPKAFLNALCSDKDTGTITKAQTKSWPASASGDLIDRNKYQYIHENSEGIPEITLDTFVQVSGVVPDAVTIDVEGAELLVLKGAEQTLKTHHPKLFVSIHDDLGLRDYGVHPWQTIAYLATLGYQGEYLATDHEAHWYFE